MCIHTYVCAFIPATAWGYVYTQAHACSRKALTGFNEGSVPLDIQITIGGSQGFKGLNSSWVFNCHTYGVLSLQGFSN